MNTNSLKAKLLSKQQAYILFFIFQAPYAYVGKWKMQLLYWFICLPIFAHIFMISTGEFASILPISLLLIWPINQFFAIPNKIKKYNLKIYEEQIKSK
jgi:hypothetical protein